MTPEARRAREKVARLERGINVVLRVGVIASFVLVTLGTILSGLHRPHELLAREELLRLVQPGAAFPRSFTEVGTELRALRGVAVTTVGLLLLMALPVVRLLLTAAIFVVQKDRVYLALTLLILALLVLSPLLGGPG